MRHPSHYAAADEATLVALAKLGDDGAFEELVRRRQSWLRNLLARLSGDDALADDLAQQAFLRAWQGLGRLKTNRAFGSWLRRMAVNVWLNHVRIEDPLDTADVDAEALRDAIVAPGGTPGVERIDLDRALALLPREARVCVVLAYSEGMSHGEIADHTGLPLGTVKSHINRGTQKLRRLLEAGQRST